MKKILLLLLCSISLNAIAQEITYDEFRTIIPFLVKEDFKSAFEKSDALLKRTSDDDDSDLKAQVSYIAIFAAAGMVTKDEKSYEDFEKITKRFIGKRLKMSGHPCVAAGSNGMNTFQFVKDEETGKQRGATISTNKDKTNILLFEYYDFPEIQNPDDYVGKTVRCGGILDRFELSPTSSKIWIARIQLTQATINIFVPR